MTSKPRVVDLRGGRKIPPPKPEDIRPQPPRRSALKVKKRRMRAVITAGICVCALLTTYAVHVASYMTRFSYEHVAVTGGSAQSAAVQAFVEKRLAESATGFISGRNIFLFRYESLGSEIVANFPQIKDATIARDTTLGNGLVVTLIERSAYALWCGASGNCYVVDDEGVVFAPGAGVSTSTLPTPYIFTGALSTSSVAMHDPYGGVFAGEHFVGIQTLLSDLKNTGVMPLGANLETDTDFQVPLREGYYLKASYGEDPENIAKNLSLVLNSDALKGKAMLLEYVDLRFGNRVYYKFKNTGETTTTK